MGSQFRHTTAAAVLLLALLPAACDAPTQPYTLDSGGARFATVAGLGGCTALTITLSGVDKISVTAPGEAGCPLLLRLAPDAPPTYRRTAGGLVELPLLLVNPGETALGLPVRLLLRDDSVTILHPPGLGANGKKAITPVGADSTFMDGAAVVAEWRAEGNGTLAPGQGASLRVTLSVPSGILRFRVAFSALTSPVLDTEPPAFPGEGGFAFADDTLAFPITPPGELSRYYRTLLAVVFGPEATGLPMNEVLAKYDARVVGGAEAANTYVVQITDPGPAEEDVFALVNRVWSESAVEVAYPLTYEATLNVDARFPGDGQGMTRSDWTSQGASTWGLRAIRAPQSWGCETGTYGSAQVKVAAMDLIFDNGNQDLSRSSVRLIEAKDSLRPNPRLRTELKFQAHGTMVAGAVAATGDNGFGVAGQVWEADLSLFAFGKKDRSVASPLYHFNTVVLPDLLSHQSRVLVSAMALPWASAAELAALRLSYRRFLATGGLIVLSAGNSRITMTLAELASSSSTAVGDLRVAAQLLQEDPDAAILIVGGVEPTPGGGVTRWSGSNYVAGGMQIAAPATNIPILIPSQLGTSAIGGGTSVAAPMVAGVAAQLLNMAPGLTGRELKDYIVRGARVPRYRADQQRIAPPDEIPDMAGVRILDAFGSLQLLSQERVGTPVCGVTVSVWEDDLTVHRDSVPGGETHAVAGATALGMPSVAQGGRRIAVSDNEQSVLVVDPQGHVIHTRTDLNARQYLEKDTADLKLLPTLGGGLDLRITGPSGTYDTNVLQGVATDPDAILGQVRVSPDAERIAFSAVALKLLPPSSGVVTFGIYLKNRGQSGFTVIERTQCTDLCGGFEWAALPTPAWTATGEDFVVTVEEMDFAAQAVRTRLLRVSRTGSVEARYTIPDRFAWTSGVNADMTLFESWESNYARDACFRTERTTAPLGSLEQSRSVSDPDRCWASGAGAGRSNAPTTGIIIGNLGRPESPKAPRRRR